MRTEQVVQFMKRQPFQPFDITMSDGRAYTIEHPEWVSVSPSGRTVTTWTVEDERLILLDSMHITTLAIANRPTVA